MDLIDALLQLFYFWLPVFLFCLWLIILLVGAMRKGWFVNCALAAFVAPTLGGYLAERLSLQWHLGAGLGGVAAILALAWFLGWRNSAGQLAVRHSGQTPEDSVQGDVGPASRSENGSTG